jgi:hypothetical protein
MLVSDVLPGQTRFGASALLGPCQSFPILVSNLRPEHVPEGQAQPVSETIAQAPERASNWHAADFPTATQGRRSAPIRGPTFPPVASNDQRTGCPRVRGGGGATSPEFGPAEMSGGTSLRARSRRLLARSRVRAEEHPRVCVADCTTNPDNPAHWGASPWARGLRSRQLCLRAAPRSALPRARGRLCHRPDRERHPSYPRVRGAGT